MVRPYEKNDLKDLARLRAAEWGSQEYWENRIAAYVDLSGGPQSALNRRTILVSRIKNEENALAGFIAGHLSQRYDSQGELQWINIHADYRQSGVASELLKHLAQWFIDQGARKICVNVEPDNKAGIHFYAKHQATRLNDHWMIWEDISVMTEDLE